MFNNYSTPKINYSRNSKEFLKIILNIKNYKQRNMQMKNIDL